MGPQPDLPKPAIRMSNYKGPKLTQLHGAQRDARIKQLLSSPGTRKLVPTKDLPADLRAKRQLNQRLAQPIVPGSSTTQRDLAHQREAAVNLQYGPNAVGASQQRERETGDWYDAYLRELAQHAGNVQGFGQQAQDQINGLTNIQGPADTAPKDPQNQTIAQQAAAVRSALLGGLKTKIQGQATAANTYADTLAHVVAPGQKVQALTAARGNTDQLRQQIGAYRTKYEGDARTEESKNVLARQALLGDIGEARQRAKTDAQKIDLARGVDPVTGQPLPKDPKTPSVITGGAFAGYTKEQVAGMSPAHKQKLKTDYDAGKGKAKEGADAPEWLTQQQMSTGLTQLTKLKDLAGKARTGQPFIAGHARQRGLARPDAAKKIFNNAPSLKDPALLTAALDAVYDGHLSSATVRKLIDAGYKPARVAQTLGVPTARQMRVRIHSSKK